MSLTKFTGDTNNVQSLPDQPTLTTSQLKATFDKTGNDLKTYINDTLTEELDTTLGTINTKLFDSGYISINPSATSFEANGGVCRKIGNLVEVTVAVQNGRIDYTSSSPIKIGTIPVGFRPSLNGGVGNGLGLTTYNHNKFFLELGVNGDVILTLLDGIMKADDMLNITLMYFVR